MGIALLLTSYRAAPRFALALFVAKSGVSGVHLEPDEKLGSRSNALYFAFMRNVPRVFMRNVPGVALGRA